jgi:hypothetical protein
MISLYFTWEFAKKFRKTLPTQTIAELPGQLHGSRGSQNMQRRGPWHSGFKFSPLWSPYSLPKKKKKRNRSLGIVEILQIQKVSPATERT